MRLSEFFWAKRFAWTALLWTIVLICIVLAGGGLGAPFVRWLFFDRWEWMPFGKWLHYALLCVPGGMMTGSFFTLGEWIEHSCETRTKKIWISVAVVSVTVSGLFASFRVIDWFIRQIAT